MEYHLRLVNSKSIYDLYSIWWRKQRSIYNWEIGIEENDKLVYFFFVLQTENVMYDL